MNKTLHNSSSLSASAFIDPSMSTGMEDNGNLDGKTILRFTHATEKKGGVEQYLEDLNQALLQRSRMTIIELYMPVGSQLSVVDEKAGRGRLIRVPMTAAGTAASAAGGRSLNKTMSNLHVKELVRDAVLYNPLLQPLFRRAGVIRPYSRYEREPLDAAARIETILRQHCVDLIVLHAAGGQGGFEVIEAAKKRGIPYVLLNHFSNDRFKIAGFREQSRDAAGVGGVSAASVPRYLRKAFCNVSDGIDIDFFRRDGMTTKVQSGIPAVLLPSRLVPGKGHHDLVRAAYLLQEKGIACRLVFAGRNDDAAFLESLQSLIRAKNLDNAVLIAGELGRQELRQHYASSRVVALPSHNEGLGRVLLEAQAMGTPVVAYDVGGVSEALQDGISGYLARKGRISDLAAMLGVLLTDDRKHAVMGRAGRKFVEERFSFSALARWHDAWYLRAMAGCTGTFDRPRA